LKKEGKGGGKGLHTSKKRKRTKDHEEKSSKLGAGKDATTFQRGPVGLTGLEED